VFGHGRRGCRCKTPGNTGHHVAKRFRKNKYAVAVFDEKARQYAATSLRLLPVFSSSIYEQIFDFLSSKLMSRVCNELERLVCRET